MGRSSAAPVLRVDVVAGLNESRALSVQVDPSARTATVWLAVRTLPEVGPPTGRQVTVR